MIDQLQMMEVLTKLRGDAVVMPVFRANLAWNRVSSNPKRDVPIGTYDFPAAMGIGPSFALGFCLARPDTKVILLDGDGSLLMNLGALVTVAHQAPKNMFHFVMDNGVYATTGGQDTPGAGQTSLMEMALAAGYAKAYQFDDIKEFASRAGEVLDQTGPVLVCVKTVPDVRHSGDADAPVETEVVLGEPQGISNLLAEFGGG